MMSNPRRVCRPWTTKEVQSVLDWIASGKKQVWIARRLNRAQSSIACVVSAKLNRPRLPRAHRPGELAAQVRKLCIAGVSDGYVGGILGVTAATVATVRTRLGIPNGFQRGDSRSPDPAKWTGISNRAKFLRLYSGVGRGDIEIARIMGITKQSVRQIRISFGLPPLGAPGDRGDSMSDDIKRPESSLIPIEDAKNLLHNGVRFGEIADKLSEADLEALRAWYTSTPGLPSLAARKKFEAMNGTPPGYDQPAPAVQEEAAPALKVTGPSIRVPSVRVPSQNGAAKVASARQQGYTGNACVVCQGVRMTRNGACEKCEDCGSTTGCA